MGEQRDPGRNVQDTRRKSMRAFALGVGYLSGKHSQKGRRGRAQKPREPSSREAQALAARQLVTGPHRLIPIACLLPGALPRDRNAYTHYSALVVLFAQRAASTYLPHWIPGGTKWDDV